MVQAASASSSLPRSKKQQQLLYHHMVRVIPCAWERFQENKECMSLIVATCAESDQHVCLQVDIDTIMMKAVVLLMLLASALARPLSTYFHVGTSSTAHSIDVQGVELAVGTAAR